MNEEADRKGPGNFTVSALIEAEAERLATTLRNKLIPHAGELGRAREVIVREYIQQQLPKRFGVDSGFVFDVHGSVSRQMDIVIHDREDCPVFTGPGGVKFFPCEGVVAVGEVKSKVTSVEEYQAAMRNLASAKSLDRSGGGSAVSMWTGEPITPKENHLHQIFSFLFTIGRSLRKDTAMKALYEHLWNQPRYLWPNASFMFDDYLLTHACAMGICPNPMDAFAIGLIDKVSNGDLLLSFTRMLAQAVVTTQPSLFSYSYYLSGNQARQWTAIPFESAPVKGPIPPHLTEIPLPEGYTETLIPLDG